MRFNHRQGLRGLDLMFATRATVLRLCCPYHTLNYLKSTLGWVRCRSRDLSSHVQGIVAPPISLNLEELCTTTTIPSIPPYILAFTLPSSHTPTPEIHTSNSLHQFQVISLLPCLNTERLRPTLRACPPRRTCSARVADNIFVDLQTLPAHQPGQSQSHPKYCDDLTVNLFFFLCFGAT